MGLCACMVVLQEVEARVLNAVQPPLCLDPTPEVAEQAYVANYNKVCSSFAQLNNQLVDVVYHSIMRLDWLLFGRS